MNKILASRWTKAAVFVLCLYPALNLAWALIFVAYLAPRGLQYPAEDLGANPVEFITHRTGDWIIRFLMITLSITPLRKLMNLPQLARHRRMLGLFAFFYGCCHLMTWAWLDKSFDWSEMGKDILKRKFITVGMTALLLMIPLAITSTSGWVRRLGFVRWQKIHRLIYFSALAGVIHYYWLVKSDVRLPLMYGGILTVLMCYRLVVWLKWKGNQKNPAAAALRTS